MIYEVAAIVALAQQCAPEVATEAVVPLVVTESGGDPLRINVNKGPRVRASSASQGAAIVRRYMAAGYTVDVGLAQINSANFARLGVNPEEAFEPCTNLRLASKVLQEGFELASRHYTGLDAISATYSVYNTGTLRRGFRNGYVNRVWSAARALGSLDTVPSLPVPPSAVGSAPPTELGGEGEGWVVGQIASNNVEVFK
jgi:type IV secretion system protein VirB1